MYPPKVFPDLVLYGSLQCSLVAAIGCQPVHVPVPDRIIESGDDFVLPAQEIGTCQIRCDRVMGDKGAVNSQVLHEKLQFFQHLLLRERIKLSALSLLQQGRAGEQGQPAGSYQHGLALAEDFRRVDRMLAAMGSACHAVQECHPVIDPHLLQLMAQILPLLPLLPQG